VIIQVRHVLIKIFAYTMLVTSGYKFFLVIISSPVASTKFFLNIFFDICWLLVSIAILNKQLWARKSVIFLCLILPGLFGFLAILFLFIDKASLIEILTNKDYMVGLLISFFGLWLFIPQEIENTYFKKPK